MINFKNFHYFILMTLFLTIQLNATKNKDIIDTKKIENQNAISYILRVIFPQNIENIPTIYGYYKGYKLEFDGDFCVISQNKPTRQFILVITPKINYRSDGNNIKYLERIENKPCKLYYVTSQSTEENNIKDWSIEEENIDNLPLRLPEDSLVLLMNPNHIENLHFDDNLKRSETNNNIVNLPNILIKKNISEEELNSTSTYALLAAIDSNAIHTPQKKTERKNNEMLISMRLLQR